MSKLVRVSWWQHALLCLLLVILTCGRSLASETQNALDGYWKGPLQVPGGKLEVIFRLVKLSDGTYFAAMDVPLQKVSRMPVAVTVRGDTVSLAAEEAGSRFMGRLTSDGKKIDGTWSQPGLTVPMLLEFVPATIDTNPKARLTPPYREEEVLFTNIPVDLRLAGMLTIPAGKGPFPAVVLVSDAGAHDREGATGDYYVLGALGDYLTRRGIAVLRFDDRGVGKSGGEANKLTVPDMVSDVQAALNFLRTRPEIDLEHLGVVGHGEGGNVALLTAAQPLPPSFVVTLGAPGLPGKVLQAQQQANILKASGANPGKIEAALKNQQAMFDFIAQTPDPTQAKPVIANMLRESNPALDSSAVRIAAADITSPRYKAFLSFDPTAKLGNVKCPVLLLNGTADLDVGADANLAILTKCLKSSNSVTPRKLLGVNHLFQADPKEWPLVNGQQKPVFSPIAQEAIREWVVQQTQPDKGKK
jgi:pimeloyl-ACP methyl ester carboxylesterase